ncbi:MAG: metalloregulator ArsR/SmtB family transcription factor [Polyangiaceae bacterium]
MLNNAGLDRVFHALAEPTRRAIVERLSAGPSSVSELAKPFDMTLAAVVQHLQVLEQSGIVRSEKVGRTRTCRIEPAGLTIASQWLAERQALWQRRLDRLADILGEPVTPPVPQAQLEANAPSRRSPSQRNRATRPKHTRRKRQS